MRARFITLEGIDGSGKSTQIGPLAELLRTRGVHFLLTREPGGTELGERLRELLLASTMHPDTEALLMAAARREHLEQVIRPALAAGTWVISDRFVDASFAYQGGGRGVDRERLQFLEDWVVAGTRPDLTLLFDLPEDTARGRLTGARAPDKFEREDREFFRAVRAAYLDRAQAEPARVRRLDASLAPTALATAVEAAVAPLFTP